MPEIERLTEMKNAPTVLFTRFYMIEEKISELKERSIETPQTPIQMEKQYENMHHRSLFTV